MDDETQQVQGAGEGSSDRHKLRALLRAAGCPEKAAVAMWGFTLDWGLRIMHLFIIHIPLVGVASGRLHMGICPPRPNLWLQRKDPVKHNLQ